MKENLRKRLPKETDDKLDHIVQILEQYDIKPNITNFDQHGFRLFDARKRIVRILDGTWRSKTIHVPNPHSDIAVVFAEGMLVGWIESYKLTDLVDRFLVDVKSLNPMPPTFDFSQPCEHMSVHGGFSEDGENWICYGCGVKLVFSE